MIKMFTLAEAAGFAEEKRIQEPGFRPQASGYGNQEPATGNLQRATVNDFSCFLIP